MALTHGDTVGRHPTPEWRAWYEMIQRCTKKSHPAYARYGGRGIGVCMRWIGPSGYKNFLADVGRRPSSTHSLDRYPDNNGHYEPGNVRWATSKQQGRNRRDNRLIEHNGETRLLVEWAELVGISKQGLSYRISSDWSFEDAISTPPRTRKKVHVDG